MSCVTRDRGFRKAGHPGLEVATKSVINYVHPLCSLLVPWCCFPAQIPASTDFLCNCPKIDLPIQRHGNPKGLWDAVGPTVPDSRCGQQQQQQARTNIPGAHGAPTQGEDVSEGSV